MVNWVRIMYVCRLAGVVNYEYGDVMLHGKFGPQP